MEATNILTFEQMPQAIGFLINEVEELKAALLRKSEPTTPTDQWFNVDELRDYLPDHPAKATIYGWVSSKQIPNHKGGKKLRFLKSEIDNWLAMGKRKSESELQEEAAAYKKNRR
jgi:excisionase family DNA binding protein